ncbi:DUF1800 family protein [Chryseobacterium indoltheticum]|uniref:DUF1800 family protein n=1 Tax=Chryseobacterium indoltheticum TaxID=254 RepID=UPI003F49A748
MKLPILNLLNIQTQKQQPNRKREIQKINQKQNNELNLNFLKKMTNSKEQLREKWLFSGTDILQRESIIQKFNQQLLNTIREKSLGNFKDLLFEVSVLLQCSVF